MDTENRQAMDSSFSDFYEQEYGRLVRSLSPFLGPNAEDVAQDAFVVLQQRWDEVAVLDVPYAWVRRVAMRMGMRAASRDSTRARLEPRAAKVRSAPDRRTDPGLLPEIAALPHRQAMAVWLHHIEDRPIAEVAEQIGCSLPAVKVLLYRGRRSLAERLSGVEGRWVSERVWDRDAIVGHLRQVDADRHVDTILERDLGGRGGRWELAITTGSYELHRDDGLRLDLGSIRFDGNHLVLTPTLGEGRVLFSVAFDGNWMRLTQADNTTPPTLGVPDWVWMSLFLGSGTFVYSGRPRPAA